MICWLGSVTSMKLSSHPLFQKRPVKTRLYIVITSNSGLAGAYNSNVLKQFTDAVDRLIEIRASKVMLLSIGKQGAQFLTPT